MGLRNNNKPRSLAPLAKADASRFHNPEAEIALLGAMLISPKEVPGIQQIIQTSNVFSDPKHVVIYEAMIKLTEADKLDVVQLHDYLKAIGHNITPDYLALLAESVPSAASGPYYAQVLQRCYESLKAFDVTVAAAQSMLDRPIDAATVQAELVAKLTETSASTQQDAQALGDIALEEVTRVESGQQPKGIRTGFHEYDEITGGVYPSEMTIIGARPSVGKTAVAITITENVAKDGHHVAFFSAEMSRTSLTQRFLSYATEIGQNDIRTGNLDEARKRDLREAAERLRQLPIVIDDTSRRPSLIRARVRQLMAKVPLKLVVIDYLQLLAHDTETAGTREQEVGSISRGCKAIAHELGVGVILLSQLSRAGENRDQRRPRLTDLRESGAIEQDADVVLMLHQEDYHHRGEEEYVRNYEGEMIVAKQRNGATGTAKVEICRTTGRWLCAPRGLNQHAFGRVR